MTAPTLIEATPVAPCLPARPRAQRHRCDRRVSCYSMNEEGIQEFPAHLKDISLSGMALVIEEQVLDRLKLGVEMHCPDGMLSYLLVGQVVRRLPFSKGGWLIGCAFDRPLGEEELGNLL